MYIMDEKFVVYNSNTSIVSTALLPIVKEVLENLIPNEDIILYISFFLPRNLKYKIYHFKYKQNRKQKYHIKEKVTSRYR